MKTAVQNRCDLVVENRNAVEKGFMLENNYMKIASASMFAERDLSVDEARIKECRALLRKNQGAFSNFRCYNELIMSSKMALAEDAEKYMQDVLAVYEQLHKGHLCGSNYRALAAMSIVDMGRAAEAEAIAEKTDAIMKGMKAQHRFLTSESDFSFAVMLALNEKSVEEILSELETSYEILNEKFKWHCDPAFSLAQVLVTQEGTAEEKANKVVSIYESLKAAGIKYGKGYELASLGALVSLDVDTEELATEISEVAAYLKKQKGFKTLSCAQSVRYMFSSMICAGVFSGDVQTDSVVSRTVSMIIAEQTAMMIMMMCAISASAAAATN